MSWTFFACVGIAFVWMGLFYLWGRGFLTAIHAKTDIASCIPFGYLTLQSLYQVFYLPFFVIRGSYRVVSYSWLGAVAVASILLIIYLCKHSIPKINRLKRREKTGIVVAITLVLGLAFYIALHVPFYGADTVTYISTMNEAYYKDSIWLTRGYLSLHHGLCSFYQFFTISSLLTGIRPYYISLFSVRIIGVFLFFLIIFRTGKILYPNKNEDICWSALSLSVISIYLLMLWGSNYTAEFFYWRINEGKGFCQFVLLPMGFSTFLKMFIDADRKTIWKEQLLVGLSAIPVSTSSMTSYIFLVFLGTIAILTYDKLKRGWRTMGNAIVCILPNTVYLVFYILVEKGIIVV